MADGVETGRPGPRVGPADGLAVACFFASGFVTLVYEICWIRKATLVFGAATFAVSTVVAVFFAGLALGSYVFGRYGQRLERPLKTYGVLEIGVALLALASPALFAAADVLYSTLYPRVVDSLPLLSLTRFLLVSLILLPPTILMGGTLPLFCRQYVRRAGRITFSVGMLYGWNTLGAAAGCAVCGFLLLPLIGVNVSIYAAGAVNVGIGAVAWLVGRHLRVDLPEQEAAPSGGPMEHDETRRSHEVPTVYALFFLTGFVVLGYEILWVRFLALLVRNTVYTYTVTLSIILVGIVLGSLLIAVFGDRLRRRALVFGLVQVLIGIIVLAVLTLPADWWRRSLDPTSIRESLWAFFVVLLVPAILSGASFPLAIRMVVERPALATIGVGKMTALNTLGGILGSLAVGFALLPAFGLHTSLLIMTGTSLAVGFLAWLLLERSMTLLTTAVACLICGFAWFWTPNATGTRLPADHLAERDRLVDFREGLGAHLAVVRESDMLWLEIDQMWQGQDTKNHQIMAAHVPMLLHADPRRVVVVGVGTGQTPSRFLMYDVERLDCVDLEGGLFDLIRAHFDGAWLDDPRVRLIVEDGRNYLTHTDQSYDIISIEVGQIFRPGIASFYTRDFYAATRQRLRPGGLLCQFVPITFLTPEQFETVLATFLDVFPRSVLWYNTAELLLIGTAGDAPMLRPERLRLLETNESVRSDLEFAYWGGPREWLNQPEVLAGGFLAASDTLAALAGDAPIYADDRPYLEYEASPYRAMAELPIVDLLRGRLDPFDKVIAPGAVAVERSREIRDVNLSDIVATAYKNVSWQLPGDYRRSERRDLLVKAVEANPQNVEAHRMLGDWLMAARRGDEALRHYQQAIDINEHNATAQHAYGRALLMLGRFNEAAEHLRAAIRADPRDAGAMNNYALVLLNLGDFPGAVEQFAAALRVRPGYSGVLKNIEIMIGMLQQRIGDLQPILANDPGRARTRAAACATAEPVLRRVLDLLRETLPDGHWQVSNVQSILGESLTGQGKFAAAEPLLLSAHERLDGGDAPPIRVHEAVTRLVRLYAAWGKTEEARAWRLKLTQRGEG